MHDRAGLFDDACRLRCDTGRSASDGAGLGANLPRTQQAERLYGIMVPLLRAMNDPLQPSEVHVGIIEDPQIDAANAGICNFYVTTGLLEKPATDSSGDSWRTRSLTKIWDTWPKCRC